MIHKINQLKIILASRSPARKKLLKKLLTPLGLKFSCYPSGYKENMNSYKNSRKLAVFLALNKAKFIAHKFPNSIIIGADTFITVRKKIVSAKNRKGAGKDPTHRTTTTKIGKPRTITEAKEIIASMSGKTISVHSGIAVIKTAPRGETASRGEASSREKSSSGGEKYSSKILEEFTDYDLTKLKIKKMSEAEINLLAHQKNALQISGAFSIEGAGGKMIEKIIGDYDNVIGLPIYKLKNLLKRLQ